MVLISAGNYLISFKSPPYTRRLSSCKIPCIQLMDLLSTPVVVGSPPEPHSGESLKLSAKKSQSLQRGLNKNSVQADLEQLPNALSPSNTDILNPLCLCQYQLCPGEGRQNTTPCALYPFGAIILQTIKTIVSLRRGWADSQKAV